jgi:drug/metabolite transporter (DMT)-like permease
MRRHREVPMLPAMGASAWLCALFCVWFADPLSIDVRNFVFIAMFGVLQNAAGLVFYVFGSKRVPAAEATLIAALEVPFTPFWVLLFFNEVPGLYTLLGGAIVLVALFTHILGEFRRKGPTPEPFAAAP